eukprot:scaffold50078_cov51-Attheya_sp.AAC.6
MTTWAVGVRPHVRGYCKVRCSVACRADPRANQQPVVRPYVRWHWLRTFSLTVVSDPWSDRTWQTAWSFHDPPKNRINMSQFNQ